MKRCSWAVATGLEVMMSAEYCKSSMEGSQMSFLMMVSFLSPDGNSSQLSKTISTWWPPQYWIADTTSFFLLSDSAGNKSSRDLADWMAGSRNWTNRTISNSWNSFLDFHISQRCQAKVLLPAPGAPSIRIMFRLPECKLRDISSRVTWFLLLTTSLTFPLCRSLIISSSGAYRNALCEIIARLKTLRVGGGGHWRVRKEGTLDWYFSRTMFA